MGPISTPEQWNATIGKVPFSWMEIYGVKRSPQWAYVESKIREHYGRIEDLSTIEIGAGLGKMSSIVGLMGAKPTVLDYSPIAIGKSKLMFESIGVKAEFAACDAICLPDKYHGKYDVSFSLGAAEHFVGSSRETFIAAHYKVLKPGGISFIIVPNRISFPYRIGMCLLRSTGQWNILEVPFGKKELSKTAIACGFSGVNVYGFNFQEAIGLLKIADWVKYLLLKSCFGSFLKRFRVGRPVGPGKKNLINETEYRAKIMAPIESWKTSSVDNLFGYALIMHGLRDK